MQNKNYDIFSPSCDSKDLNQIFDLGSDESQFVVWKQRCFDIIISWDQVKEWLIESDSLNTNPAPPLIR